LSYPPPTHAGEGLSCAKVQADLLGTFAIDHALARAGIENKAQRSFGRVNLNPDQPVPELERNFAADAGEQQ